jgi:hypothetical protein
MVTFRFPTTALREVEGRIRRLSWNGMGREISHLALLAACLLPNVVAAQAQQDQLTLTADITATGRATTSLPGVVDYHDNLSVTAHGLLVQERDPQNTNSWVVVSSNYSLEASGGGSEQDLLSTRSWTYQADNPDDFSIELGADDFNTGQLHFVAYSPSILSLPADQNVSNDAYSYLFMAWKDFDDDASAGLLTVPINGQPFSISSSSHKEEVLSLPYIEDKGTFDVTFRVSFQPGGSHLAITSLQTPTAVNGNQHTFVSTDSITVQAKLTPPKAGAPVLWSVVGKNAASQSLGIAEIHNADASGISTFTFSPSQDHHFVQVRHAQYTSGIKAPANDPLSFEIVAGSAGLESRLSGTTVGPLLEDETDTLRQEYVDFQIAVPPRTDVVPSLGSDWNRGPYHVQVSVDLPGHYNAILAAYQGSSMLYNGVTYTIPANAQIKRASVFRNPRYNKAIGSVHPNSRHCYGRALDLAPIPIALNVNGQRVQLDIHDFWYPALGAADQSVGLSPLPEQGATPLDPAHGGDGVGDPDEDHLHVQW